MYPLTRSTSRARFFGAAPSLLLDFLSGSLDSRITFTRASTATFFNSSGVLTSASNDVARFDYDPATLAPLGLLIEESRTNSIRNNTMQGAVAGSPGTLPTNWSISAGAGLSSQVVGTGTESGVTYIDIRIFGTTAGAVNTDITFEITANVSALTGQTWAESIYKKLVGGTLTNVSSFIFRFNEYTSGGVFISGQNSSSLAVPTSSGLATQRVAASVTLNGGATTAQLLAFLRIGAGTGAVDFTLRIGLPQLEQGAFATSVIPTTTTALTRAADVASVNTLTPWFNASAGTIYADFAGRVSGAQPYIIMLSNTGETERIYQRYVSGQYQSIARVAGVDIASVYNSSEGSAVNAKIATAYDSSQLATSTNGQAVTGLAVASLSSVPSGLNKLWLGSFAGTSAFTNGYLRRITYYPRRLANAELQSLTL
jgi:hypothetical protein